MVLNDCFRPISDHEDFLSQIFRMRRLRPSESGRIQTCVQRVIGAVLIPTNSIWSKTTCFPCCTKLLPDHPRCYGMVSSFVYQNEGAEVS